MTAQIDTSLPLPNKRVERIDVLQVLRAVAVFLVAWTHAGQLVAKPMPSFGIFGVDIFFVISGFILSLIVARGPHSPGKKAAIEFTRRRCIRIFPVYWIFALYSMEHQVRHHAGLLYLPAFFLLPGLRYPDLPTLANFSWTLIFEMFFYLLFAAVLLFAQRQRAVRWMVGLLFALVLAGHFTDIRNEILIVVMNPILLEFAMGAGIAILYVRVSPHPTVGKVLICTGAIAAVALYLLHQENTYEGDILTNTHTVLHLATWGVAAALIVAGGVLWSPAMTSGIGRFTVLLGNASYSTYLLSGLIFMELPSVLSRFGAATHTWVASGCFELAITALLLAAGLAFYFLIEKPLLSFANSAVPPVLITPRQKRSCPVW